MNRLKHGFTLIEILVVIVIIGILSVIVTTNFVGARERAQDSQKKSNLNQLKIALRSYYAQHKTFPASTGGSGVSGMSIFGCGATGTSLCGDSFTEGNPPNNIEYLPKFAKSGNFYEFRYYQCTGGDDFRATVSLSNKSDPDIAESKLKCPASSCAGPTLSYDGASDKITYVLCND